MNGVDLHVSEEGSFSCTPSTFKERITTLLLAQLPRAGLYIPLPQLMIIQEGYVYDHVQALTEKVTDTTVHTRPEVAQISLGRQSRGDFRKHT